VHRGVFEHHAARSAGVHSTVDETEPGRIRCTQRIRSYDSEFATYTNEINDNELLDVTGAR